MAPTLASLRAEYKNLWDTMVITTDPAKVKALDAVAKKIVANRARYEEIEAATGVPWQMIGVIHNRECSLDFSKHLHCGDPLTARTYRVPKGRPVAEPANGKCYTFQESAIDAVKLKGWDKIKQWSIEQICYSMEQYNGWGYRNNKYPLSAYMWSYSQHYTRGKYIRDHVYSPTAIDKQIGAMPLYKRVLDLSNAAIIPYRDKSARETVRDSTSLPLLIWGKVAAAAALLWDATVSFFQSDAQAQVKNNLMTAQETASLFNINWDHVALVAAIAVMGFVFFRELSKKKKVTTPDPKPAPQPTKRRKKA